MFNHPSNHKKSWIMKGFFAACMIAAGVLLFGGVVMLLWNAILPKVANVSPLNFWQAVGLLALSRILFGGFRFGRPGGGGPAFNRRKQWREKWMNMSEEEKAEFKAKWRERCGRK